MSPNQSNKENVKTVQNECFLFIQLNVSILGIESFITYVYLFFTVFFFLSLNVLFMLTSKIYTSFLSYKNDYIR